MYNVNMTAATEMFRPEHVHNTARSDLLMFTATTGKTTNNERQTPNGKHRTTNNNNNVYLNENTIFFIAYQATVCLFLCITRRVEHYFSFTHVFKLMSIPFCVIRSEEHTSELQSQSNL